MRKIRKQQCYAALLASSALFAPSMAQAATPAPRFVDTLDDHGVDLASGLPFFSMEEGGIGSGPGAVRLQRIWSEGAGWTDNWSGGLFVSGGKTYVQIAGISESFTLSNGVYVNDKANGATLVTIAGGNLLFTAADGTKINFYPANQNAIAYTCAAANAGTCQIPTQITRPDGIQFNLTWNSWRYCLTTPPPGESCVNFEIYQRLKSISSSAGYQLTIAYAADTPPGAYQSSPPPDGWFTRNSVSFTNTATPPNPLPAISYAYPDANTVTVTDPGNRTWTFTTDASGRLTGVKRPGSASNNVSYGYGADGTVNSSTRDGVTNTYSRSVVGSTATETLTNPLAQQTVVVTDLTKGRPTSYKDGLNRTTAYQYDANARLTQVTAPEGNAVQYAYDPRGNVTTTTNVAKSGSGLSNIVASASFDASCANVVKCNKPNSTTDARGNVTDYAYDPTHGGVTAITRPAAVAGGTRPQTRLSYTQVTSASADLVYMPTKAAACQTLASCTGAADETQVVASYNGNLLPTSVTRQNGTASLVATSTPAYDARGRLTSLDGPLSGTGDTTRYAYDSADQLTQVTSPDPDGAGALPSRAVKLTYRGDGQVSKRELGTAAADGSGFVAAQTVDVTFDANNRPVTGKLSASGTDYALTQTSYDSLGRVDCSVVRMNTAVYGSLPASACTLGTEGSFGPDRISQTVYDAAGEVTQLKVAVGTTDAATERTLTYTNNGLVSTLLDAENNLTTYEYDGFDRLAKTRFPVPAKGANSSSTTDYEQLLNYDANSNVGSRRLRDGTSIAFSYDNLDRVTLKDLPGTEPDVTYGYDLLGRLTSASQTGNALSFSYDALSRKTGETGPNGTTGFGYDLAGEKTGIAYPAGGSALTIGYTYLTTGELSAIQQSGTNLASYGYDNLGNRTSVVFDSGASQSFTYDPVSRLASLTNDLSGTANDLTKTFAYNPASQIVSETRSNDAYAFSLTSGTTNSTSNGLNQLATIDGAATTWQKGNLHNPLTGTSYCYSSENLLTGSGATCSPPATGMSYDPALRLYQVTGAATTRIAYDGLNAIAEYDGAGTLQRRFVFDPTSGQPVVWYLGTHTDGPNRLYLSQDERGSVISASTHDQAAYAINRYDEYGVPGAANVGPFQYTGQRWLPDSGVYHYKARAYFPGLGIFGQTDPIGQVDSPNLYAYVLNDPVNLVDPFGLQQTQPPEIVIIGRRVACPNGGVRMADGSCTTRNLGAGGAFGGIGGLVGGGERGDRDQQNENTQCPATGLVAPPAAVIPPRAATAIDVAALRLLGIIGLALSLGSDTPQQRNSVTLRHYTDRSGYNAIIGSGYILPISGYSYFTPNYYSSGSAAQAALSLSRTPIGYFAVSSARVIAEGPPTTVRPGNGQPGGGLEIKTQYPVKISPRDWRPCR